MKNRDKTIKDVVTILHVGNQKMITEKQNYEELAIILLILATGGWLCTILVK